jgi:glycerate kinase
MKVLIAPNAFKGTLTAPQAAAAIARGVREVFPQAEVVEIPVADGGDGTVEALVVARRGEYRTALVEGPLGDPTEARYGLIDSDTAVVELATASGLTLIDPKRRDPRRTSTYGFGQLLDAARRQGVTEIIAGIGGSATNDGGAGMAQALGIRLVGADGRELARGGAALINLDRVDPSRLDPGWSSVTVRVACDVTNPLTGPNGASHVYGPQKGADPATVEELDRALKRFGQVVGVDDLPGAGAAGGTGAGLVAFLGAALEPGAPLVVGATGFDEHLPGSSVVFTGEGRADQQTAYGKAPGEVAKRAAAAGIPVVLLAGSKGPGWEALSSLGVTEVVTLAGGTDEGAAFHDPEGLLYRASVVACRSRKWER